MADIPRIQTPQADTARIIQQAMPQHASPTGEEMALQAVASAIGGYTEGRTERTRAASEAERIAWERGIEERGVRATEEDVATRRADAETRRIAETRKWQELAMQATETDGIWDNVPESVRRAYRLAYGQIKGGFMASQTDAGWQKITDVDWGNPSHVSHLLDATSMGELDAVTDQFPEIEGRVQELRQEIKTQQMIQAVEEFPNSDSPETRQHIQRAMDFYGTDNPVLAVRKTLQALARVNQ